MVMHAIALLAIPAFLPAFALVGAIIWIARKDRLDEQREHEATGPVEEA